VYLCRSCVENISDGVGVMDEESQVERGFYFIFTS
jgi:hypothetical protein